MNYKSNAYTEAETRMEHSLFWFKVKGLLFIGFLGLFFLSLILAVFVFGFIEINTDPQHPEFPNWYANCGVTRGYWYDEYNGFTEYLTEDEFTEYCQ